MKIVLLPGMDGTGKLFAALLPYLNQKATQIVSLPSVGPQTYEELKEHVGTELPREDYVLVAESFSGPIAVLLANEGCRGLKALILVATFISAPNSTFLRLAQLLPIKGLMRLPLSSAILRAFMLGSQASDSEVDAFKEIVGGLPAEVLRSRLQAMQSLSVPKAVSNIPSVYIRPTSDRLVPRRKALEIRDNFNDFVEKPVRGPHFILQANPRECAAIINEVVECADRRLI